MGAARRGPRLQTFAKVVNPFLRRLRMRGYETNAGKQTGAGGSAFGRKPTAVGRQAERGGRPGLGRLALFGQALEGHRAPPRPGRFAPENSLWPTREAFPKAAATPRRHPLQRVPAPRGFPPSCGPEGAWPKSSAAGFEWTMTPHHVLKLLRQLGFTPAEAPTPRPRAGHPGAPAVAEGGVAADKKGTRR